MARIPDQWSVDAPRWGDPTTMPQYDASALTAGARGQEKIGQAIGQLGKSLGGILEAAGAEQEKNELYRLETSFIDHDQSFDNEFVRSAREDIKPDGEGFREGTVNNYTARAREWIKSVPDKYKPYFDNKLARQGAVYEDRARSVEYAQLDKWTSEDLRGREKQVGQTITERLDDPDGVSDAIGRHIGAIRASRLSPARKDQEIKRFGAWAEKHYLDARRAAIFAEKDSDGKLYPPEHYDQKIRELNEDLKRILPADYLAAKERAEKQGQGPQTEPTPIEYKPMPAGLREDRAPARPGGPSDIKGFVVHETASPTAEGVEPTLGGFVSWTNQSNTGANYYIGKDGTVYQMAGDDRYLNHVRGADSRSGGSARMDLGSANTLSVEIITRRGERPNDVQIAAAENLVRLKAKEYGFDPVKDVYGHEELDRGHREATEGMDVVKRLRSGGTMVADAGGKVEVGVNKFAPPNTPGVITAAADQTSRATNDDGYGDKLSGKITVNGRTYEWVSGGREGTRGSIPTGTYAIQRYTSASQRANEGKSFRYDAFELNAAQDDIGKAAREGKRDGLLIHDGRDGVTAGCIGIVGDFAQFKKDLAAEQAKNGGKLHIQVGTKSQLAEIEKVAKTASVQQPAVPPLAQRATMLGLRPPKTAAAETEGDKPPLPGRSAVGRGTAPAPGSKGIMLGFKGVDGAFDQEAFEKTARAMGYEPKVISAWKQADAVKEAQAAIPKDGKYAVYGFSLGAQSARDLVAAGAQPAEVITVGAHKDARLDFKGLQARHYFDQSGRGNAAQGEFIDAPHTGKGNVQSRVADRIVRQALPGRMRLGMGGAGSDEQDAGSEQGAGGGNPKADKFIAENPDPDKWTPKQQREFWESFPKEMDAQEYLDAYREKSKGDASEAQSQRRPQQAQAQPAGPSPVAPPEPLAVGRSPTDIATVFDGIPDHTPLSELQDDVRERLFSNLPPEVTKQYNVGAGQKVSAADVVTVGEIKEAAAQAVRAAEIEKGELAPPTDVIPPAPYQITRNEPRKQYQFRYLSPAQIDTEIRNNQVARRSLYIGEGGVLPGAAQQIMKTGVEPKFSNGMSVLEAAKDVLMPNQLREWQQKFERAREFHRVITPIPNMTDPEMTELLNSLAAKPGDDPATASNKAFLAKSANEVIKKEREARRADPVLAVESAPEVKEAYAAIKATESRYTLGTGPDGQLRPVEQVRPKMLPTRQIEALVEARLAAQERILGKRYREDNFIDGANVLRNSESQYLMSGLHKRAWSGLSELEKQSVLREAARRADEMYGKYARRAWDEAVRHYSNASEREKIVTSDMLQKLVRGEPIDLVDVRRYQMLREAGMADSFIQPTNTDFDYASKDGQRIPGSRPGTSQAVSQNRFRQVNQLPWQEFSPSALMGPPVASSAQRPAMGSDRVFSQGVEDMPSKMPQRGMPSSSGSAPLNVPAGVAGKQLSYSPEAIAWLMQDFQRRAPIFNQRMGDDQAAQRIMAEITNRITNSRPMPKAGMPSMGPAPTRDPFTNGLRRLLGQDPL